MLNLTKPNITWSPHKILAEIYVLIRLTFINVKKNNNYDIFILCLIWCFFILFFNPI